MSQVTLAGTVRRAPRGLLGRRGPVALAAAAVAVAAGAAALGLAGPAVEHATAEAPAPPRLLVTAEEWRLTPSRTVIDPGDAIVQLYNHGEDSHDLWIRRVNGVRTFKSAETLPGEVSEFIARLRAGRRYRLWCSLPGHRELGMRTRLRVNGR